MSWAVVVPTNRPEKFQEFYTAWKDLFENHAVHLVIIEDNKEKSDFTLSDIHHTTHLCWEDIPEFIPRKTDMIRSWGFYYVWKQKLADYILTLDDDVLPVGDTFDEYMLPFITGSVCSEYFSVGAMTTSGVQMRGFPYKDRKTAEVAVQYGGWDGVLDYDAATQLAVPMGDHGFRNFTIPVPKGAAVTGCIMNCAFKTSYAPIMWQLTMIDGRYNRVGDIWSGLFIKRTLDAMNKVMVINGNANVLHKRASDPYSSLQKEAPGVYLNDNLWNALLTPKTDTMLEAYRHVTDSALVFFRQQDKEYADKFKEDRNAWLDLFQ